MEGNSSVFPINMEDFSYCLSSQLALPLTITLISPPTTSLLHLIIQPLSHLKPLTQQLRLILQPHIHVQFPILYSDLPLDTIIVISLLSTIGPRRTGKVGEFSFKVFGKNKTVRTGSYRLNINKCSSDLNETLLGTSKANQSTISPSIQQIISPVSELSKGNLRSNRGSRESLKEGIGEVERLDRLRRKYERNDLPKVDWMDRLIFNNPTSPLNQPLKTSFSIPSEITLKISIFDFPVVYNETTLTKEIIYDPDVNFENAVESKHRKVARSHRTGRLDRELKPNSKYRDELNIILKYPSTRLLTQSEKDLVWKFRFHLSLSEKKALTKFVRCVIWDDKVESKQGLDLMENWVTIDIEDSLELLGPMYNKKVRRFAVEQLSRVEDEELTLYLLQLVQAIKFEEESCLVKLLIERGIDNTLLGNTLYWYLMVETEDKKYGKTFAKVIFDFLSLLIKTKDGIQRRDNLRRQGELVSKLEQLSKQFRLSKEARPRKIVQLQNYISEPKNGLLSFPPLALPLDPSVIITGMIASKSSMFKSGLSPLLLTFRVIDGSEYQLIFKSGDDLRQDQLVIQMVTLMDLLLRMENVDLKITSYRVLATGNDHGMLQFIPSETIASILTRDGSLSKKLEGGIEGYVRSLAGYCVMMYLMGVGDRHLDNLLLSNTGSLFHIDFGFILGRDPKPFPPPMKISKEMVEVMGGVTSSNYQTFRSLAFISFNSLRKSSNLILNLFALMVEADIPDLKIDRMVSKVQERFVLELTDEEAIHYFQGLIDESVGAYFPQLVEQMHRVAQLFRS